MKSGYETCLRCKKLQNCRKRGIPVDKPLRNEENQDCFTENLNLSPFILKEIERIKKEIK